MSNFGPTESTIWQTQLKLPTVKASDAEINAKYESGELRIVTETNREKLPIFVEAMKKVGYMEIQPFYQRRKRWDNVRQSRLIESFIMNVPVPPVFLFEKSFNSYEVMDGQQRITAIRAFYEDGLKLEGLQRWPELNGRTYRQLPSQIKAGIDRRSISSVVMLKESAMDEEDAMLLRQMVFERLNTGGVKLSHQEIRNALYHGPFNKLLIKLAKIAEFRAIWDLPPATETEDDAPSEELMSNPMFQKMEDIELVLRFCALRHLSNFAGGMQDFLTRYMIRTQRFTEEDLGIIEAAFLQTLNLALEVFGPFTFKPYLVKKDRWASTPHKAFYDAVMIGLNAHLAERERIVQRSAQIVERTKALFVDHVDGTFTGRGNSRKDIQQRVSLFSSMIEEVLAQA